MIELLLKEISLIILMVNFVHGLFHVADIADSIYRLRFTQTNKF